MPIKQPEGPIKCETFQKRTLAKGENLTRYVLCLGEGSDETDRYSLQGLGWERRVTGHFGGPAKTGGVQGERTLIWLQIVAVLLVKC